MNKKISNIGIAIPVPSYNILETLSRAISRKRKYRKDTGMSNRRLQEKYSLADIQEKCPDKPEHTIKINVVNSILAAFLLLLMAAFGYIGSDLKQRYLDIGDTKIQVSSLTSEMILMKNEMTRRFDKTDFAIESVMKVLTTTLKK